MPTDLALRACPSCGSTDLEDAGCGDRWVCRRCARCWGGRTGSWAEVDALACPGCRCRPVCLSCPTILAEELSSREVLSDGTVVLIRPVLPGDRGDLAVGFQHLSPEGRRLRFFSAPAHLSESDLDYLTDLDYRDHFAWAAFAVDEPGRPGIGVARYVRDGGDPARAEAAVTVLDAYQRRGLGTLLLFMLAGAAMERGIRTFVAHVLWENLDSLQPLLSDLGARTVAEEPGVVRVEVDLPAPEPPAQGFLRRLLRDVATYLRTVAD